MGDEHDERYMRMALRLAIRGAGRTSPNPMVGAVLVRSGKIVATGYHKRAGEDHAEIVAVKRAGSRARGATLYINLEPCAHYGRTPPCAPVLVKAGIKRVVAGMADPNPRVAGRGIRTLRRAGIQVDVGLLEPECRRLNEAYIKYIRRRVPFVILKLAASLDGKIATSTGDSHWITGPVSRTYVHRLRNQVDAVLVGVGTVAADNPRLTCRLPGGRDPLRIIVDGRLGIPLKARLLHQRGVEKTIVATGSGAPVKKVGAIRSYGAQVWRFPLHRGMIRLASVLQSLGKLGLSSVMIEGGAATAARALSERIVDKLCFFYAPKIIGGEGRPMIEALGIRRLVQSKKIKRVEIKKMGEDFLVSGYL
ncbi:MAG: bifunctional diaminohydroxyphosphoribosylaminopyrimidine deaminase/5-amino-6-(5-phosphoribosylamino)uracil reductase RibD [Candidatus Binatia bacterium]